MLEEKSPFNVSDESYIAHPTLSSKGCNQPLKKVHTICLMQKRDADSLVMGP